MPPEMLSKYRRKKIQWYVCSKSLKDKYPNFEVALKSIIMVF